MKWHIWIDAGLPAPSIEKLISKGTPHHELEQVQWKRVIDLGEGVTDVQWMSEARKQAKGARILIISQDGRMLKVKGEQLALAEKTDASIFLLDRHGDNHDATDPGLIEILTAHIRKVIGGKNKFIQHTAFNLKPPHAKKRITPVVRL
jgi:hypothetical protein